MGIKKIIHPSFEAAQALYSVYSTIADNYTLEDALNKYVDSSFLATLDYSNIREIYNQILLEYYPNESCIKAEFINHILLKGKSHVSIFELPVGSSRADLCKINGASIAYEIKTDLDNFSRLSKQINDYLSIFEFVYVICSSKKEHEIMEYIPNECGIYTYRINRRGNYQFELVKKASLSTHINSQKQLSLLRKNEFKNYFNISIENYSKLDSINQILHSYDSTTINNQFKIILKNRYLKQWNFLKDHKEQILEIDYQWFFKNPIAPPLIYNY